MVLLIGRFAVMGLPLSELEVSHLGLQLFNVLLTDGFGLLPFPWQWQQVGRLEDAGLFQLLGAYLCLHDLVGLPSSHRPLVTVAAVVAATDGNEV